MSYTSYSSFGDDSPVLGTSLVDVGDQKIVTVDPATEQQLIAKFGANAAYQEWMGTLKTYVYAASNVIGTAPPFLVPFTSGQCAGIYASGLGLATKVCQTGFTVVDVINQARKSGDAILIDRGTLNGTSSTYLDEYFKVSPLALPFNKDVLRMTLIPLSDVNAIKQFTEWNSGGWALLGSVTQLGYPAPGTPATPPGDNITPVPQPDQPIPTPAAPAWGWAPVRVTLPSGSSDVPTFDQDSKAAILDSLATMSASAPIRPTGTDGAPSASDLNFTVSPAGSGATKALFDALRTINNAVALVPVDFDPLKSSTIYVTNVLAHAMPAPGTANSPQFAILTDSTNAVPAPPPQPRKPPVPVKPTTTPDVPSTPAVPTSQASMGGAGLWLAIGGAAALGLYLMSESSKGYSENRRRR
jgi:hypothetical protein